jgi:hypothetical protein
MVLGDFDLFEKLGIGGMGTVYRARQRSLDRPAAVKVLSPTLAWKGKALVHRFQREWKAIGSVDHPNIVKAYAAGEEGQTLYLAMELLEGSDLHSYVREHGRRPWREACDFARQAALALEYLHQRGLVHRDVKPSNLMRTSAGVVKLLDLGLVRWSGEGPSGDGLTRHGEFLGTPSFVAPEQAQDAASADGRADLYGLGCTLFFLLTGQAPFEHSKPQDGQPVAAQANAEPRDLRSLRPDVPPKLARLVGRLLAKGSGDRPQTAAAVAAELAAIARKPRWPLGVLLGTCGLVGTLAVIWAWHALLAGPPAAATPERATPATTDGNARTPSLKTLVVETLNVEHFRKDGTPCKYVGEDSFDPCPCDKVVVEARLSREAFAYLIAFNPDGTEELCFPASEETPPTATAKPRYPLKGVGKGYGLTSGAGLQVFAVVVSEQPLPAYREWKARRAKSPWKPEPQAPRNVVWRSDGGEPKYFDPKHAGAQRSKDEEVPGYGPLVTLVDWLRKGPKVEAVEAIAFPVLPEAKK